MYRYRCPCIDNSTRVDSFSFFREKKATVQVSQEVGRNAYRVYVRRLKATVALPIPPLIPRIIPSYILLTGWQTRRERERERYVAIS